ncbi:MAG: hypothetical protein ACHQ6U_00120 [Thermodesulfobacteriota bacterium]
MKKLLPALILIPLLLLIPRNHVSWGADARDDSEEISCPDSCENTGKNCQLSCSQMMGGGVANEKKRQCSEACDKEVTGCVKRCANPTPRPTIKPKPYHDKSCADVCEYRNRDCAEDCTKYMGGGAASVKKTACLNECGEKLDKCTDFCANPGALPTFSPEVYKNTPCSDTCGEKRMECEGTCGMFTDQGAGGGKRGECFQGCKKAEYDCLGACAR